MKIEIKSDEENNNEKVILLDLRKTRANVPREVS